MSQSTTFKINRAPVLTLWAAIVAQRLGFDHDEALTLGRAVAGLNAQSKGKRLVKSPMRAGAFAAALILVDASSTAAGVIFECKAAEALEWETGKFLPLSTKFEAFWKVSSASFYVDTDTKQLRFPSFSVDFQMSQNGGEGDDWVMVSQPLSTSPDLYLRIRPFEPPTDSETRNIPFGAPMPFLMIHPFHVLPVTGNCRAVAGFE